MTATLNDHGNFDDLFAATYGELRSLASAVKGRDKSATLNPTALVHEAWLKLAGSPGITATFAIAFQTDGGAGNAAGAARRIAEWRICCAAVRTALASTS
jgi:hypothetical protein